MSIRRCVLPAFVAGVLALSTSAPVQTQIPASDWTVGDVFVGIGAFQVDSGTFLVLNPDGTLKETLVDAFMSKGAGRVDSVTTGCAIGPAEVQGALYATSFHALKLRKFPAAHPHAQDAASTVFDFTDRLDVTAIESIVFDNAGNYYVGAHGPERESATDTAWPVAYIYKFDRFDRPVDTDGDASNGLTPFEVPNGDRGVDWLDLGSDNSTLFYTSESNRIHVYRPSDGARAAEYREIVIHERSGTPIEGRSYALRALPPAPGDSSLQPSGFLVATHAGPVRTDASGMILYRYNTPGATGTFFSLNLTPDGRHFWSANFPDSLPDGSSAAGTGGQLFKYHVSHADPVAGPIDTGAQGGIWGTCIRREYTAAVNTCYKADAAGRVAAGPDGAPQTIACTVPEVCGNGLDDNGNGTSDQDDPDCVPPGAPRFTPATDQVHHEGETILPLQLTAVDPQNDPVTFTVTGLPRGLSSSPTGLITGTVAWSSSGPPHVVRVTVSDGTRSSTGQFTWTILQRNAPLEIDSPGNVRCLVGEPCPTPAGIEIPARDPNGDSAIVWLVPGANPAVPGGVCTATEPCTGLPPGMTAPAYVSSTIASADTPSVRRTAYPIRLTGSPAVEGVFVVQVCAKDDVHLAPGDPPRPSDCEGFTVTVGSRSANRPPEARDDLVTVVGASPTRIPVLANDRDADGDALALVPGALTQPAHGTVSVDPGGGLLYVARLGFAGVDTFTYEISDGMTTDAASVTVAVESARICYAGQAGAVGATQDWWYRPDGAVTIRTTLSRSFADNTYGDHALGWPGRNHKFNHLVSSDMVQVALHDTAGTRRLEMKLDYFSESPLFASGYGSHGIAGGEGAMVTGSAGHVLGADSSLARNFNELGYRLTSSSPATDARYTPNAAYPNWIFDVWYEVTVSRAAFSASAPFAYPRLTAVHASPSKTGVETPALAIVPCAGGIALSNVPAADLTVRDAGSTLAVAGPGR